MGLISKRPSTVVLLASGFSLWKNSVLKHKITIKGGGKKAPAESQSYLCGSFLVLSTGIVDSDEGRIGHDETVPSDSALLKAVEICTCQSDILSSPAQ